MHSTANFETNFAKLLSAPKQEPLAKRPKGTDKPASGSAPDASLSDPRSSSVEPSPARTAHAVESIESDDLEAKLTYYKGLVEKWLLDREVWVKKQEQLLGLDK